MEVLKSIVFAITVLGSGGLLLGYVYLRDDAKIKLARTKGTNDADVEALRREVEELRRQLQQLRETSTAYDLSLEATLNRLERRLEPSLSEELRQRS